MIFGRNRGSADGRWKAERGYPGANELVLPTLPLHLILYLLHDTAIDLYYVPVSECVPTIRAKERPIPSPIREK